MSISSAYVQKAALILEKGWLLQAPVGTRIPTQDAVDKWIQGGAIGALGDFNPIGYSSGENLPTVEAETEGGEKISVFENPDFDVTPITRTTSITANFVQWTVLPLQMWKGADSNFDESTGVLEVADSYRGVEMALFLIAKGKGTDFVGMEWPRVTSSPEGSPELEIGSLMEIPIKFTVLKAEGVPHTEYVLLSKGIAGAEQSTPEDEG